MAERSIVAVSKTVEGNTSGGSNPPLSAGEPAPRSGAGFLLNVLFICNLLNS